MGNLAGEFRNKLEFNGNTTNAEPPSPPERIVLFLFCSFNWGQGPPTISLGSNKAGVPGKGAQVEGGR